MQNRLFENRIEKGKFNDTIKLWDQYKNSQTPIDIHSNNEKPFLLACKNGHIYIAKWLFTLSNIINSPVNININDDEAFRQSCSNGFYEIAKWLIDISPEINIHAKNEEAFIYCCRNGNLVLAKWLWNISIDKKSHIDLHAQNEGAFRWGCYNDNYDVVFWLTELGLETNSPINIHVDNESAFLHSCYMGNYKIVKFLLEFSKRIRSPINIRINNDYSIQSCCKNEHIDIAKLLCSYCDNYIVNLQNRNKINYHILSDDEVMVRAIITYNKIWLNKDDTNLLKKMFSEHKIHDEEACIVCYSKKENPLLNFKCRINDNIYDHCYCTECFAKWYILKEREKKCMCCYSKINLKDCVLVLPK
jgi:ankyrin repeat protein